MKSQQIREGLIAPYLYDRRGQFFDILDKIESGGWEAWLQVELALVLGKHQDIKAKFSREQTYAPGSGMIYDFLIELESGGKIYFELKTQKNENDHSTNSRMLADIKKVRKLNDDFIDNNVIIVMAVSGLTNQTELENMKELLKDNKIRAFHESDQFIGDLSPNDLKLNTLTLFWFSFDF